MQTGVQQAAIWISQFWLSLNGTQTGLSHISMTIDSVAESLSENCFTGLSANCISLFFQERSFRHDFDSIKNESLDRMIHIITY